MKRLFIVVGTKLKKLPEDMLRYPRTSHRRKVLPGPEAAKWTKWTNLAKSGKNWSYGR